MNRKMFKFFILNVFFIMTAFLYSEPFNNEDICKIDDIVYTNPDYPNLSNNLELLYDGEDNIFYLHDTYMDDSYIFFTWSQLNSLRATVSKAADWCTVATDNYAEIEKEIPNSQITTTVVWKNGENIQESNDKLVIQFIFTSEIDENENILPILTMKSNSIKSSSNKYCKYKLPKINFGELELYNFVGIIKKENINNSVSEFNKNKKTDSLFQ